MSSDDLYRYTPLGSSSAEIRLLTILPGVWPDQLQCTLEHVSLADRPEYEALSYTWGDPTLTHAILVNEKQLGITTNLAIALRYLRRKNVARVIWADAICICQTDIEEKNSQIPLMRGIYRDATTVLAWTGEDDADSFRAFRLILELSNLWCLLAEVPDLSPFELEPADIERANFDLTGKNWNSLWTCMERPCWSRLWVMQELAPPEDWLDITKADNGKCLILSGNSSISRFHVALACAFLLGLQSSTGRFALHSNKVLEPFRSMVTKGFPPAIMMFRSLNLFASRRLRSVPIITAMTMTTSLKTADPRDKIYAILGLPSLEKACVVPDYSKSPARVYQELVQSFIASDRNLDVLRGNRSMINHFGPTWIPCLYDERRLGLFWWRLKDQRHYNASGTTEPRVSFDMEHNLLLAHGLKVGDISTVIGPMEHKLVDATDDRDVSVGEIFKAASLEKHRLLAEMAANLDDDSLEVFWRAIIMDSSRLDGSDIVTPCPQELKEQMKVMFGLSELPTAYKPELPPGSRRSEYSKRFGESLEVALLNRCFITTKCGKMGVGCFNAQPGDVVALLYGGDVCFMLRPCGVNYKLIGDAYIQGIMRGEMVEQAKPSDTRIFSIC